MKNVLKCITIVIIVITAISCFTDESEGLSWLQKIIRRMKREGIDRVDSKWDDSHAFRMAVEAYILQPKFFSGNVNMAEIDLLFRTEEPDMKKVKEDVAKGEYGPTPGILTKDAIEVVVNSLTPVYKNKGIIDRVQRYKMDALSRISAYMVKAESIKKLVNVEDINVGDLHGKSFEYNTGVTSDKTELLTDNTVLKTLFMELAGMKVALTGEIGLLGTASYANFIAESMEDNFGIYDTVAGIK